MQEVTGQHANDTAAAAPSTSFFMFHFTPSGPTQSTRAAYSYGVLNRWIAPYQGKYRQPLEDLNEVLRGLQTPGSVLRSLTEADLVMLLEALELLRQSTREC